VNKIYRTDTRHVTVAEAKKLIRDARQWGDPADLVHGVFMTEDGLLDVTQVAEDWHGLYVGDDFPRACARLEIVPFDKYRPALATSYPGGTAADFIRLADLYGLEVGIGQPSASTTASEGQERPAAAPSETAAAPLWALKPREEMRRMDALREALYEFLRRADKTTPLPTPWQVLEAWRTDKPIGVARVNSASVDFDARNADGEKQCDLTALKERIKNMTKAMD
jgi:hypothetical protein